eukprot:6831039-Pyramimonas_sp.AAC.1
MLALTRGRRARGCVPLPPPGTGCVPLVAAPPVVGSEVATKGTGYYGHRNRQDKRQPSLGQRRLLRARGY